jgi:hypothetical protein
MPSTSVVFQPAMFDFRRINQQNPLKPMNYINPLLFHSTNPLKSIILKLKKKHSNP